MPIPVLLETADLLAIDKSIGVATIPGRGSEENVLALLEAERQERLFMVHRLDKEVSGVLLLARNAEMHRWLNGQFEQRLVEKRYALLVHGPLANDEGLIDAPIREFGSGRMGIDRQRGKPSVTRYRVVERREHFTRVDAFPETGRRHQLRVHFYSIGHPIVGDLRYGDRTQQSEFPRLMLHAAEITFTLPAGEQRTVVSPLPELFSSLQ